MRALTVVPKRPGSIGLVEMEEPAVSDGALLVDALAVGVCGTDREIVDGGLGEAPPGQDWLVLGHESLGRVVAAPAGSTFVPGDLVVGIVRRPDPVPCPNCAAGEWDMCRNGRYTERGIKQRHGYASERFRLEPEFAIPIAPALGALGVLLEPASVVAKAWDHVDRIGHRASWQPTTALVTGAGPIGLLAALLGVQRGFEVHVLDRVTDGPKPELVRDLGATYHTGAVADAGPPPDVVVECTGVGQLVLDAIRHVAPGGVVCLAGISSGGRPIAVDAAALNREIVVENAAVFGSVNANRRHFTLATEALARADRRWLERLITRRVPLARWREALMPAAHDIKTVIELG
jgi:threonine dehydrogenase-like Zn-dependent dehydrogenase